MPGPIGLRLAASSVIQCPAERSAITAAIRRALATDCSGVVNPYGDGHSSERILAQLKKLPGEAGIAMKPFHDL